MRGCIGLDRLPSMPLDDDNPPPEWLETCLQFGWWRDSLQKEARPDSSGGSGDQDADRMADARMEAEQLEARLGKQAAWLIVTDSLVLGRVWSRVGVELAKEHNLKARAVAVGGLTALPKGGRPTYPQVLGRSLAPTSFLSLFCSKFTLFF